MRPLARRASQVAVAAGITAGIVTVPAGSAQAAPCDDGSESCPDGNKNTTTKVNKNGATVVTSVARKKGEEKGTTETTATRVVRKVTEAPPPVGGAWLGELVPDSVQGAKQAEAEVGKVTTEVTKVTAITGPNAPGGGVIETVTTKTVEVPPVTRSSESETVTSEESSRVRETESATREALAESTETATRAATEAARSAASSESSSRSAESSRESESASASASSSRTATESTSTTTETISEVQTTGTTTATTTVTSKPVKKKVKKAPPPPPVVREQEKETVLPKTGAGDVEPLLVPLGLGLILSGVVLRRGFREQP